ncbi:MAG TPA: hypothetical protein VHR66_16225 [Gemmataceae bacterium]|jgi:hypothetical protein|nr:hypothetical protein [Gemmataceae bacterium]
MSKPKSLTLRTYQVGFGDCFLLKFKYATEDRHVLVDFGSTGQPKDAGDQLMLRVAKNIAETCGGKLNAVVATHRHKDHISGFATNSAGTASGDIIAKLKPDVVVQPWTEDPDAKPDATRATHISKRNRSLTAALSDMHAFSQAVLDEVDRRGVAFGPHLRGQLGFLGEDNLANKSAVENLMSMGKKNVYVNFGTDSGLEDVLPGVKTTVLGPPTLEQTDTIRKQRATDQNEFWHLQAAAGQSFTASGKSPFAPRYHYADRPPHTRWFIPRMDALRGDQLLQLVRALDKQMNNTSVILLFEAGDKKLLFPGDAQIENWSYALEQAEKKPTLKQKLESVNLYKVGHHGSLNATPKSLWKLFEHKGSAHEHDRLQTVVSTMAGKHGSVGSGTEVPRSKLVDELKKQSDFFTTQSLKKKDLFHDVEIDF